VKLENIFRSSLNTAFEDGITVKNWVDGLIPLRNLKPYCDLSGPEIIFEKKVLVLNIKHKIDAYDVACIEKNPDGGYYNANSLYLRRAISHLTGAGNIPRDGYFYNNPLDFEQSRSVKKFAPNIPPSSRPIYLITVTHGNSRRIVYIGKSINAFRRFRGGHAALVKLLHPKYDCLEKNIFFCEIYFGVKENYDMANIDSIISDDKRMDAIDMIEAFLINFHKPELNTEFVSDMIPSSIGEIELAIHNSSGYEMHIPCPIIDNDMLGLGCVKNSDFVR